MIFHRKFWSFAACMGLLMLGAGCSGINLSPSVSPATFLLPGLMKVEPPPQIELLLPGELPPPIPVAPAAEPTTIKQVASAR